MARDPASEDPEFPAWMLAAGRLFGWSPIQTRWKLLALVRKWRSFRQELAPQSRGFEHQICGECGAVQDNEARVCSSCGEKLASPAARFFRAVGLSVPTFVSASGLLGAASIVVYFRMMMEWRGQGLGGWEMEALIAHGGLWPPAFFAGQWWRIGTANFLHIGVLHILFNTVGLSQIGPSVEEVFGRGRMVFFFAVTGLVAFAASAFIMPLTPTAGASGALMGLVGVAAGWGQRCGTSHGKAVRNQMLKWGLYTMVFGLVMRANNVAHAGGFIAGALIGAAFSPHSLEKTKGSLGSIVMGVVGSVACAVFVMIALFPPASSRALAASEFRRELGAPDGMANERSFRSGMDRACELLSQGKKDDALLALRAVTDPQTSEAELDGSCAYLTLVRERCADYRDRGLDAVLEPYEKENAKRKLVAADYYRVWCAKD